MPPRNLYIILIVTLVSALCHVKAQRTRDGALVGEAIALVDHFYVDRVQKRDLLEGAMSGLTSRLDPYTQFIPPTAYDSFQDAIEQEFAGIGILIDQLQPDRPVRVVTPLVGSPAIEAGFQPGDLIVSVAGQDTSQMPMEGVRKLLRGPIGSQVQVTVRRPIDGSAVLADRQSTPATERDREGTGEDGKDEEDTGVPSAADQDAQSQDARRDEGSLDGDTTNAESAGADSNSPEPKVETKEVDLRVSRANIRIESVTGDHRAADDAWVYTLEEQPSIAYIRLTTFGERTPDELSGVLKQLDDSIQGVVLDLRGNSGGLLLSAVDVCDMFLHDGRIVSTRGRGVLDPNRDPDDAVAESAYDARPGVLLKETIPIALLIDGESASAAEIVAACLKDQGRATIVGERSFGKGSVQNVFVLESGRSALKLTTARYYRPNGENIHRGEEDAPEDAWGVRPSDGFEVLLDQDTRRKAIQRWERATYPSMASALGESDETSGPLSEVDPQLWRAVEAIRLQNGGSETIAPDSPANSEIPEPAAA